MADTDNRLSNEESTTLETSPITGEEVDVDPCNEIPIIPSEVETSNPLMSEGIPSQNIGLAERPNSSDSILIQANESGTGPTPEEPASEQGGTEKTIPEESTAIVETNLLEDASIPSQDEALRAETNTMATSPGEADDAVTISIADQSTSDAGTTEQGIPDVSVEVMATNPSEGDGDSRGEITKEAADTRVIAVVAAEQQTTVPTGEPSVPAIICADDSIEDAADEAYRDSIPLSESVDNNTADPSAESAPDAVICMTEGLTEATKDLESTTSQYGDLVEEIRRAMERIVAEKDRSLSTIEAAGTDATLRIAQAARQAQGTLFPALRMDTHSSRLGFPLRGLF